MSYFLNALADAEDVPVRMTNVHLADVPWHVGRWESDVQVCGQTVSVDFVNVLHPYRHPHALVARLVSAWSECRFIRAFAAAALASLTEKNLAFAGPDRAESRGSSPVPAFLPTQLLEP